MTDKQLAEKFKKLQETYMSTFLVKDTEAFELFCFDNSAAIKRLLLKAAKIKT